MMSDLQETPIDSQQPVSLIGVELHPLLRDASRNGDDEMTEAQLCRTAECAYYKAEARGFAPGHELEDWFAAEEEVNP